MKRSLGKAKERKWSADMSSTNFFEDESSMKTTIQSRKKMERYPSKHLKENSTSINCDNIKISIVINNDQENNLKNIYIGESPHAGMEKDSLEFNNLMIKSKKLNYQRSENNSRERGKEVFYGSPAIWLKNIKRNSDKKENSSVGQNFSTRSISKMKLKGNLKNKKGGNFNSSRNQVNESPSHFQLQKNSPVMLKFQIYKENTSDISDNKVEEKKKKISVWAKNQSFHHQNKNDRTRNVSVNEYSFNLHLGNNPSAKTFKTLMNNSKLQLKNERKFSNINHHMNSKLTNTTDKGTEIDENINTCSYLDFSEILLKKEHDTPKTKMNFLLKNKIRKIKSPPVERLNDIALKDGIEETLYLNNLRVSKTHPHSEKSESPATSKSNSDKTNNICNIGSKTITNSESNSRNTNSNNSDNKRINTECQLIISKESSGSNNQTNSNSESSSLFKTINDKIQFDQYLNKSFNGKIKWRAGEVIAEGTSSIVYKALNEDEGYFFVVKRYKTISDPKMMETFQNEVKIFKQLDHPNIIKFLDSEIIDKNLFIYLEYIPNGSIKHVVDKYGPLNENLIKIYFKQILDGLEYLHTKKIVHRDVKSANILLDCKGNIKLSDFGCSGQHQDVQIVTSMNPRVNNSEEFLDSIKGTLPWMAPEVVLQQKYGKKADIWSLGCTLLEMATGCTPWGKLDNFFQAMNRIGRSNDVPEIPSQLSNNLRDLLMLCFKRNPKERPSIAALRGHPFLQ